MKVFITGICGFIGTNLAIHLQDAGFRVLGMDNAISKQNYEELNQRGIDVRIGCITILRDLMQNIEPETEAVIHLAAKTEARTPYAASGMMMRTNLLGTYNVAKAALAKRVGKLLFASSGAVYGHKESKCHPYLSRCKPSNVYGWTKLAGENLIELARYEQDSRPYESYNLRIANVYGPWSAKKGSVVAVVMRHAKNNVPFTIHGNGRQRRDFIYVGDVCESIERCLLENGLRPGTYNIATGRSISINELLRTMAEIVDLPEPIYDSAADYGVLAVSYETSGLNRLPPGRLLKDGLEETWQWAKHHLGMSSSKTQ